MPQMTKRNKVYSELSIDFSINVQSKFLNKNHWSIWKISKQYLVSRPEKKNKKNEKSKFFHLIFNVLNFTKFAISHFVQESRAQLI